MSRRTLFPVNPWPPMVDALTLVLAAFVLVMIVAMVAQGSLVRELRAREREVQRMKEERARIEKRLRALGRAGIVVEGDRVIMQGEVMFPSASDALTAEGRTTLGQLAPPLRAILQEEPDQLIMVAGHTDDIPIHNARFDSNWELSSARAVAVARLLVEAGVPQAQVLAGGFGEHHPRAPNVDETGRHQNRRIELLLVPIRAVTDR